MIASVRALRTTGVLAALAVAALFLGISMAQSPTPADRQDDGENAEVRKVIEASIGWAVNKDRDLLFQSVSQGEDLFIFHPDSASTVKGFEAFRKMVDGIFMDPRFQATGFKVNDLRIRVSPSGDSASYSALLDDHGLWDGKPTGWDGVRWTGVLEKRGGKWVLVQMHFSKAEDAVTPDASRTEDEEPQQKEFSVVRLGQKAAVFKIGTQLTTNVAVLSTGRGLVVIDTGVLPSKGAALRAAIEREFGRKDFAFVVNTHAHYDHIDGNRAFADVPIVASQAASREMRRRYGSQEAIGAFLKGLSERRAGLQAELKKAGLGAREEALLREEHAEADALEAAFRKGDFILTPPTVTFGETMTLDLDDVTVNLSAFSREGTGDILVRAPQLRLAAVGDLFTKGWVPTFAGYGADVPDRLRELEGLVQPGYCDTVVCGHGDPMSLEEFRTQLAYLRDVWDGVAAARREGLTLAATRERLVFQGRYPALAGSTRSWLGRDLHQANVEEAWRLQSESAARALESLIGSGGLEKAARAFEKEIAGNEKCALDENEMNALGYSYLQSGDAFSVVRALDEAGKKGLWPGFDPSSWPVALYDGEKTYLLRHPNPPPEFSPLAGRAGVWATTERHPAVAGNSTREIAGVRTATVMATPESDRKGVLLAIVEEVFHVSWLARHPGFRPDEMARYGYPLEDAANWTGLLAEDEALARALDAKTEAEAAGWAAAVLEIRRRRVPKVSPEVRAYETALEMMEGTANYVARRAADEGPQTTAARLRTERQAEGIRWRFYDTGAALCWILDRLAPDWKARSEASPAVTTVEILEGALKTRSAQPAKFSRKETAEFDSRAGIAVGELAERRAGLKRELMRRAGPHVVIEVPEGMEPFRPERFDPVNLFVLGGGEVVHPHFVTVRGPGGSVALTNPGFSRGSYSGTVAVTTSAGQDPMRDGFRRLTLTGVQGPLEVTREGQIVLKAAGLLIELQQADIQTDGETVRIRVTG